VDGDERESRAGGSPIPNQTALETTAITLPVIASDPDGDQVSFSATGLPPA